MGSYGYAANPVYPLETTVADINIDMLPLSGPTRDIAIFGKGQNSLEDDLEVLAGRGAASSPTTASRIRASTTGPTTSRSCAWAFRR